MDRKELPRSKLPFAAEKDSDKFMHEVILLLIKEFDKRRQNYARTENFHVFHHGIGWNFQREEKEGFKPHSGDLKLQSTSCAVSLERIANNDLTVISDFIHETANRMEEGLAKQVYGEMAAVTTETGNVISIAKEGSLADAFLKMIKSTIALVSPDGKVSMPTLFMSAEHIEKLKRELLERGPEFQKLIDTAREEQEKLALTREAERLGRYENL